MELSRRDFLKASGAGVGGIFLLRTFNYNTGFAGPAKTLPLKKKIGEKATICPYDASGCGFLVAAENVNGRAVVVNIEGDPDHPINRGAACAKGASLRQLSADNPWRLTRPLYRAPGASDWQPVEWDWAIEQVARRLKDTRDASFTTSDSAGNVVNRTEAIANLGGSALDNEECYLLAKLTRALGVVYLEHHARI
jgi:formate dehydrogenase major subunit